MGIILRGGVMSSQCERNHEANDGRPCVGVVSWFTTMGLCPLMLSEDDPFVTADSDLDSTFNVSLRHHLSGTIGPSESNDFDCPRTAATRASNDVLSAA